MGQAKKNRVVCAVTGKQIQPAECGANRMSKYACPESCPQNPWSLENYDRHLEIDFRMAERGISRLNEEAARAGRIPTPPPGESGNEIRLMVYFFKNFFRDRDAQGTTFYERWKKDGFAGLNNDQSVMLEAKSGFLPVVLEVLYVMDDRRVMLLDRLSPNPEPILVVDRALAASACRFSTFLACIYKTPFFYRLQSAAIPLPDISGMDPEEVVLELVRHHNGPTDNLNLLREWLFENVRLIADSLSAVGTARHEAMLRNVDAAFTKSFYRFSGTSSDFASVMNNHPDIHAEESFGDETEEGMVGYWVWTLEGSMVGAGRTVLCTILLSENNRVRLETSTAKNREQAKPLFEELFGDTVSFDSEITNDRALQMMRKQQHYYDPTLVPDKLLENTTTVDVSQTCLPPSFNGLSHDEIMQKTHEMYLRGFPDHPLPALDGKTPRQAADDPALRPALLRVMKKHVLGNDQDDLKTGTLTDVNSLLHELKLDEIIFPPPPLRKLLPEDDAFYDEEEEEEWEDDKDMLILPPDVVQSGMAMLDGHEPFMLARDFMLAYPEVYAYLQEHVFDQESGIEEHLQPQILLLAAKTAFLFFPSGQSAPEIYYNDLFNCRNYLVHAARSNQEQTAEPFTQQPHVLAYVVRCLGEMTRVRIDMENVEAFLFFIAFIDELHLALYERVSENLEDPDSDHSPLDIRLTSGPSEDDTASN